MSCFGCKASECDKEELLTVLPCNHTVCNNFLERMKNTTANNAICPACKTEYSQENAHTYNSVPWKRLKGNHIGGSMTKEEALALMEKAAEPVPRVPAIQPQEVAAPQPVPEREEEGALGKREIMPIVPMPPANDLPVPKLPVPIPRAKKTASKPAPKAKKRRSGNSTSKKPVKKTVKKQAAKSAPPVKKVPAASKSKKKKAKVPQAPKPAAPKAVPAVSKARKSAIKPEADEPADRFEIRLNKLAESCEPKGSNAKYYFNNAKFYNNRFD